MITINSYGKFISDNELYHYGILGQKWGVRRYQPYPSGYSGEGKYTGNSKLAKRQRKKDVKALDIKLRKEGGFYSYDFDTAGRVLRYYDKEGRTYSLKDARDVDRRRGKVRAAKALAVIGATSLGLVLHAYSSAFA